MGGYLQKRWPLMFFLNSSFNLQIMFYTRINKIKVFNNREGFLGLFNSAEMRIYSYVGADLRVCPSTSAYCDKNCEPTRMILWVTGKRRSIVPNIIRMAHAISRVLAIVGGIACLWGLGNTSMQAQT
jgi:hypothetical protein